MDCGTLGISLLLRSSPISGRSSFLQEDVNQSRLVVVCVGIGNIEYLEFIPESPEHFVPWSSRGSVDALKEAVVQVVVLVRLKS